MGVRYTAINREQSSRILAHQSPEQKLDSLEKESRNILELKPEYGFRYFRHSFLRKHRR